ncbi:Hsp70 family protein [Vulgatibacter incomptus]|uniref:Chaperone protein DnaK n=1 Tax=Vulgatibacter incomptus TaxID=1391653 RepID=A0A0K1PAB0_9BACT|nr:Hsp70 family protein [Vulgatibacter incomptus]AKU90351.1 Chaperone protein DnaK [Vulgatibacter incomptus]
MRTNRAPIIGIDLGTTNSSAAMVEPNGKVKLIPYKGGDFSIPSIFAVDDKGNELVGHEAKRQWQLNPRNTIYASKRLIGRTYRSDVVSQMGRQVAYGIHEAGGEVEIDVAARSFRMSEIAAKILGKIRGVAQDYVQMPVERAVVTVPAYFTDSQRQAVKEAGELIGLEVVRIINEPTAAALAYGVGKKLQERVLIYDLGGGTFDVSIIEIRDRVYEVKATGGDVFLGGLDFDQAMISHVINEFYDRHGIDLSTDPVAMQRIKDLAERTKIDLSTRNDAPFNIPFIAMTPHGKPLNIEMSFDRRLLEELTADLLDRTLQTVARVMIDAGLSVRDIDEILLVGGQTRMPLIVDRLSRYFGKAPSKGVHPDEAVAIGAALYAHSLEDDTDLKLQLLDVIPMAIGLERAGGAMHVIFPRNAAIPNAKVLPVTTSFAGQTEVMVRLFQGDAERVADNELLGEFTFGGIQPGAAGSARVEITFDVGIEGILRASARDVVTGREITSSLRVSGR